MTKKVLFYSLSVFSKTGGIEKFNRCFTKALDDLSAAGQLDSTVYSVYDKSFDKRYASHIRFKGFDKGRIGSLFQTLSKVYKQDIFFIGHINLSVAVVLLKLLRPKARVILITHGIEVWPKLRFVKKWALQMADQILAVSHYTRNQMVLRNGIHPSKIKLFANTIDPHFRFPSQMKKADYLVERYGLSERSLVILTVSRLVSSEKQKGYDKVIVSLPIILKANPDAVYILAGKFDSDEKKRIDQLLKEHNVEQNVIMPGFISDEELPDHYCLADVFILPSRKEGFGIVFLEALACGTPVIGGNQDGTVDALHNGALGMLINPTKTSEIADAILECLNKPKDQSAVIQQRVLNTYHFDFYKNRLANIIEDAAT